MHGRYLCNITQVKSDPAFICMYGPIFFLSYHFIIIHLDNYTSIPVLPVLLSPVVYVVTGMCTPATQSWASTPRRAGLRTLYTRANTRANTQAHQPQLHLCRRAAAVLPALSTWNGTAIARPWAHSIFICTRAGKEVAMGARLMELMVMVTHPCVCVDAL